MKALIPLPPFVETALGRLAARGFCAYAVGGCVRDSLLGRTPSDWDLCTNALPADVKDCFRDCTVLETGLAHGTVTVLLAGIPLEITTFRQDGPYSDGRRPDSVSFTGSLTEDLKRRDFTVNAIAYHSKDGLVDPENGLEDLDRCLLRTVGQPETRFREDSLRLLRAMRFQAVLGFSIEADTQSAMERMAPAINTTAAERRRRELAKLLCGPYAGRAIRENLGLFLCLLPELTPMEHCAQEHPYHCCTVLEHSLRVLEATPEQLPLRLAALLHDLGKPACKTLDSAGTAHFYGHSKISAALAEPLLKRLRFDNSTTEQTCTLIALHGEQLPITERRMMRLLNGQTPDLLHDLLCLMEADMRGQSPEFMAPRLLLIEDARQTLKEILAAGRCFTRGDLAINGRDLLALGSPPGKALGAVLESLLNRVMDGTLRNERQSLLDAAGQIRKRLEGEEA